MGGDFSLAVAVIGAACLVAIGLFATCGERWNRTRVTSTQAARIPHQTRKGD